MLIGEVARRSGVSARMLRHYDLLGLVRPTGRTVGGYREYTPEDMRRILYVEGLRSLGLSLRQIARTLDDPGFTPSTLVGDLIRKTEERLNREHELIDRLRTVDAAEPAGWQDVAHIVKLLHGLGSRSAARRQQAVLTPAEHASVPAELLAKAVLTESDPHVAGALRWALARAGGDGVAYLASGLASDDVDVRRRAVRALAELPDDEATAVLTDALRDTDMTIRRHAALALGARGVTRAVPTLLGMVVEGANDVEAAELLGTVARDAKWADRIISALVDELAAPTADSAVRMRLTQALAEMPGTIARNVLQQLAHDEDRPVALLASALVRRSRWATT
ncbi:DNA-binding transcriptional regulator, MerR family [Micromonospora pattaloongensis]|uniref:DNA-binding transcriptional regulator, MerR family n=1 Tax=Micromonospora pattaloongensis TaxID=405436 RepID=A0A1H3P332_9ACTN|nr:HEAT repeat domain-containing protein [Micromonospora pattaloongensis]SDY95383.1 DNA-binding transcriptional regulator, MerR family [Micromonospora pattaloongensis]